MSEEKYIWQHAEWHNWHYDLTQLRPLLTDIHYQQGRLIGRMDELGFDTLSLTDLHTLTENIVKNSEIEGEQLNVHSVRSSIARRLGMDIGALLPTDRHIEGIVEMSLDAVKNSENLLTTDRLFSWHAALFPTGYSGMQKIAVGQYRSDQLGAMQVISGGYGREKIHFQAPPADRIKLEMDAFLSWLNHDQQDDPYIKAGIAHLWFLTLHPFEDGNGRIARTLGDMLLARADKQPQRFYSLSAKIQQKRRAYYDILEFSQKNSLDITEWLKWFLQTLGEAIQQAHFTCDQVLRRARAWQKWQQENLNERQRKMLALLLDDFEGNLTNQKWAKITKVSRDTALRDLNDLVAKQILVRADKGGRSVYYELANL